MSHSSGFHTARAAGGTFTAGRGERFALAILGYHFIQKRR